MRVLANKWAGDLYRLHGEWDVDYVVIYGGRASSKTTEISQALAIKAARQPLRICVAREHLKSIDESAKVEITDRIKSLGLPGYKITQTAIDNENGSHFLFIGLSKVSEEDIKGLSAVDIVWVEEAHRMSHSSWELLQPTIRKEGSQIWASYNPKYRTDAISKFKDSTVKDPRVWQRKVNWRNNVFFPAKSERDRQRFQEAFPERYPHIWEGAYDDVSDKRKVLPYALLMQCVEAWDRRPKRGSFIHGGFDIADTGADKNALCIRCGPGIIDLTTWRGSLKFTPSDSAREVKSQMAALGAQRLYFDAGGIGAGMRGIFRDMGVGFSPRGTNFGGAVTYPKAIYSRQSNARTNEQYFHNWGSQAGWVLRLRAQNTQAFLAGEKVDIGKCLFINPKIKDVEDVLADLAQAEWDDAMTGKLRIEKQPREAGEAKPPSPDCFDAARLAFANDAGRVGRLFKG